MLLPITLLWNVRLPLRKKLAFMGLFSLTVITMVVAIVRAVNVNSSRQGQGQDDATFLWLWTAIQASLGESPLPPIYTALVKTAAHPLHRDI